MKPEIPPAIVDPCPLAWDGMKGDDRRRFCEHCQLHVHNLSQMNARERRELLDSGGHLCVTYAVDEKGDLLEQARRHWVFGFFTRARAAALAFFAALVPLSSSCANRQIMGKPAPPIPSPTPPEPTPPPKLAVPGGISLAPPGPSPAPPR